MQAKALALLSYSAQCTVQRTLKFSTWLRYVSARTVPTKLHVVDQQIRLTYVYCTQSFSQEGRWQLIMPGCLTKKNHKHVTSEATQESLNWIDIMFKSIMFLNKSYSICFTGVLFEREDSDLLATEPLRHR